MKDIIPIPEDATQEEIKLLNRYDEIVKSIDWKNQDSVQFYQAEILGIDAELEPICSKIRVVKVKRWDFSYSEFF